MRAWTAWLLAWVASGAFAQKLPTLAEAMQGEYFTGFAPTEVVWGLRSDRLFYRANPELKPARSWFVQPIAEGGAPLPVPMPEFIPSGFPTQNFAFSREDRFAVARDGDIWLLARDSDEYQRLTHTPTMYESNPLWRSGSVFYECDGNIFEWQLQPALMRQRSFFQKGSAPRPKDSTALERQQTELFETLRLRNTRQALADSLAKAQNPVPIYFYLDDKNLQRWRLSPNAEALVALLALPVKTESTSVPNYLENNGYTRALNSRPKVGAAPQTQQLVWVNTRTGAHRTIRFDSLDGLFDKPAYKRHYHRDTTPYRALQEKPRAIQVTDFQFLDDSTVFLDLRAYDNKDRWLGMYHLAKARLEVFHREHDDAWIGGLGTGFASVGWLPAQRQLWFCSQKTGYNHLYLYDLATKQTRPITQGRFEVHEVIWGSRETQLYVVSNESNAGWRDLHEYDLASGVRRKINSLNGLNEYYRSPDARFWAIRHSTTNQPYELYLQPNAPQAAARRLTKTTTARFDACAFPMPETHCLRLDTACIPAQVFVPKKPNGAVVFFIHGAGYLQNVHGGWSQYYREYMFHQLLCAEGFTVVNPDYRGSAGYGRDWRTAIYRQMGTPEVDDCLRYVAYLDSLMPRLKLDRNRVGIYGGSYGGFVTLMALFRQPDRFRCGAALRAVADWAHYNHPYTANILNTFDEDPEAYRRSSPIYFAEGLRGRLLLLHGLVDVNVHAQDIVRLSQRLIELRKTNWETTFYPLEDHGFIEETAWYDEYRRIYELFRAELAR